MVDAREFLVKTVADQLAQAVTIAARYSVVRTQGLGPNSALEEEVPIYSYKSQHFRILTLIAKSYAIKFADRSLRADLDQHFDHVHHGDSSIAQHAHILSAGFKAWAAQIAADGAEDAR